MLQLFRLAALMLAGAIVGLVLLAVLWALTGLGESFEVAVTTAILGAFGGLRFELANRSTKSPFWRFTVGELLVVMTLIGIMLGIISLYP